MKRKTIFFSALAIIVCILGCIVFLSINYDSTEYVIDDIYTRDDSIPQGTLYIQASDLTLDDPRDKIVYPHDGYIPNELTAVRVAEAVWVSIYGEKIYNQKPYRINLIKDSIWVVNGSVSSGGYGENAHIEIRKKDGKILKVFMGC
jgi:hypothetical protein